MHVRSIVADGSIRILTASLDELVLADHVHRPDSLAHSENGEMVAAGGLGGCLRIFKTAKRCRNHDLGRASGTICTFNFLMRRNPRNVNSAATKTNTSNYDHWGAGPGIKGHVGKFFWGALGASQGGMALGGSWGHPGPSWGRLGAFLLSRGRLGAVLGGLQHQS